MLEREKYHEALQEEAQQPSDADSLDRELLEMIDNNDIDEEKDKDKGKANATMAFPIRIPDVPSPSSAATGKRRRPMDPFSGLCGSISSCFFFKPFPFHRLWRCSRYHGAYLCIVR